MNCSCITNIKTIINNHNVNILHLNNKIKDALDWRNKKYYPLGAKCLLLNIVDQGKITLSQPNYTENVYFRVA